MNYTLLTESHFMGVNVEGWKPTKLFKIFNFVNNIRVNYMDVAWSTALNADNDA